jgi:hypothetical protein
MIQSKPDPKTNHLPNQFVKDENMERITYTTGLSKPLTKEHTDEMNKEEILYLSNARITDIRKESIVWRAIQDF